MSTFKDLLTAANTIEESNLNKNEKIPEVVAAFKKCYDLDPSNKETKRKYLSYFKRQFELEHIKKNQEELKVLGNAQVQHDRYEEAVIIYNACIDLDPSIESSAPIYSNRSLAFFNLGRFQEAEDDACMAIILKPEFARGYLRRGNAAMKLEKWKESSEAFEKYFELDPENAKSDPDAVKNKNSAKKSFDQNEAEKRKRESMIDKKRAEIMAIKNETERKKKATNLMHDQLRTFDILTGGSIALIRMMIECGADLAPFEIDAPELRRMRTMDPNSKGDGTTSLLISLLCHRLVVSPKVLPQHDELIFFVIDEMLRRNVRVKGSELSLACNSTNVGPVNAKILRVLLETNKFDVNQYFGRGQPGPLISLLMGLGDSAEVPQEIPDCLHLLLNWKGMDVNKVWRFKVEDWFEESTALGYVRHPEVAKILIRYGANVNAVTHLGPEKTNVLDQVLGRTYYPDLEELVRLLIQSGVRLLPSGRGKKSSATMLRVVRGFTDRETKGKKFVSEEVFQMMFQLNLHQGFLLKWQSEAGSIDAPFLLSAIREGAPLRFVELLCAMTPEPMKVTGSGPNGELVSVAESLATRIARKLSSFEESMQVLGVLLDHGFDLFAPLPHNVAVTTFVALWHDCRSVAPDSPLLKNIIIEKRGDYEYSQCMAILKKCLLQVLANSSK